MGSDVLTTASLATRRTVAKAIPQPRNEASRVLIEKMNPIANADDRAVNHTFNETPAYGHSHTYWLACTVCDHAASVSTSRKLFVFPEDPASPLYDTFIPVWCARCERSYQTSMEGTRVTLGSAQSHIYEKGKQRISFSMLSGWDVWKKSKALGAALDTRFKGPRRVFLARKIWDRVKSDEDSMAWGLIPRSGVDTYAYKGNEADFELRREGLNPPFSFFEHVPLFVSCPSGWPVRRQ